MTFTEEQITAAFLRWEQDLRANPGGFMTLEQVRQDPAERVALANAAALIGYMQRAAEVQT